MRKPYLLLLFLLPFMAQGQATYTCVYSGDWATISGPTPTWNPSGTLPGSKDTVIIGSGFTVTQVSYIQRCAKLIIGSGGTLNNAGAVEVYFRAVNAGTWTGPGACEFIGTAGDTVLEGGGTNNNGGNWIFFGPITGGTVMIGPTTNIVKNSGIIFLEPAAWHFPVRVLNFGSVKLADGDVRPLNGSPAEAVSWVQEANSTLEFRGTSSFPVMASGDTLVASAVGNTVIENTLNGNFNIITPKTTYYNLTLLGNSGYTVSFPSALTVDGSINIQGNLNVANDNLNLGGNWIYNSGTLTNMATVNFDGTAAQNIQGTGSTTFKNITISGSGDVALQDNTSFTGTLTLNSSGSLNGPDKMTLISNSGATAIVVPITGTGTINANFVIQMYDGRTSPTYQSLSTPVQSDLLNDWNASNQPSPATPSGIFYMSGIGGVNGNAGHYVSVYKYLEVSNGYSAITNFATPGKNYNLQKGEGLFIWMANSLSSMSPFTYITNGVPNQGNNILRIVTHNSSGYNLIGNPFPCPISWSSFQGHNSSLAGTFYIYESDQTWHPFGAGSNISMEQGFLVQASSNTTVNFLESDKTLTSTALLAPGDPRRVMNSVTFTLAEDSNTFSCPTTVIFGNAYSPSYDINEDARYIPGFGKKVPILFTYSSDNMNLIVNRLPDGATQTDVPMSAVCNVPANYTLSSNNISNLSEYQCVCLIDKKTGNVLNNFSNNSIYSFNVSQAGQEFDYILRFTQLEPGQACSGNLLTNGNNQANNADAAIAQSTSTPTGNFNIIPTQAGATINFNFPQSEDVIISAYNMLGQKVIDDIHTNVSSSQMNIALPQTTGIYAIRVTTPTAVTVKKIYR